MDRQGSLYHRIAAAFLWIAAFCYAAGIVFCLTMFFGIFRPTKPVAVGVVTIEHYAKSKDYFAAVLFLVVLPLLTLWLQRVGSRLISNEQRRFAWRRDSRETAVALLFTIPFFLSPLFYLTTGKAGWVLLLPVALAYAGPRLLLVYDGSLWLRRIFRPELHPYHALVFAEALSWIVFRYLVTGRRIAHIPTLFLESVFVALFVALFWVVALLACRLLEFNFGFDGEAMFRRIATAAIPLTLLPLVPMFEVPTPHAVAAVAIAFLITAAIAVRLRAPMSPRIAWALTAYLFMPLLVFYVSYASTAQLSQWVDLFHRGESIGPASDYLRGKAPYRGVFALHGMLQDGLLDAWLMQIFGRSLSVAIVRDAIIGGFLGVSLWYLGIVVFDSIPLALLVVAMGAWTTAENDRTFFQVAAVALFWNALRRKNAPSAVASGIFAGVALFFSYEIGMYTIAGAIATAALLAIVATRVEWKGYAPVRVGLWFIAGCVLAALPFVIYLASRNALGDFATISFVSIPRIIDAVWSLPFPDLVSTFRTDLNLHTLADFILWEKFHLILSPLTIAVAAVYYFQRVLRRRADALDHALIVLTVFATITQRTAFGRAEFRHQYFAAFLIGPMLVLLAIFAIRAVRRAWSEDHTAGTHAFLVTIVVAVVPVIGVLFWIPDLINARIDDLINYQRRVIHVLPDPHADEVWQRIRAVSGEIDRLTRPNEPIFDFSNQPAFYFFANRPNPTRFYQVPIASPPEYQAEVIRDLERFKPKVVIRTAPEGFDEFDGIPNAMRAQAIAAYLDDCYSFDRSERGVELWTRNPAARPLPLSAYLEKFHIPQKKDVVTAQRRRMVFPLIGSVAGANGAFWVSDLTFHNALREPIAVSLRFISGNSRIDRHIEIAPRQSIRWPDVVRNFFRLPGGIGTLWIEYREGRAPIAVVKTSDVAHAGRTSVESPLTDADSATAGGDQAELTIIGIPAAMQPGRRINIGVVNTGMIPATFRVTARTRTGAVVGRTIESGVPENELWFVTNAEQELGLPIDETTTIRIRAVAGRGVAFATIVEPSGDTEFIAAIPTQQQ